MSLKNKIDKCISRYNFFKPIIGKCSHCHKKIRAWVQCGSINNTGYNIIGGGIRRSKCPFCNSIDRERFQEIVYKKLINGFDNDKKKKRKNKNFEQIALHEEFLNNLKEDDYKYILHVAPEKIIREDLLHMQDRENIRYYPIDIYANNTTIGANIIDLPFKNNTFDIIIINHVLEHIRDEKLVLLELKRVLKTNGQILLSVPITEDTATIDEEKYRKDIESRRKYYGQDDHMRLYGNDVKERFEKVGFNVKIYTPADFLDKKDIKKYNIIYNDKIFVLTLKFDG